MHASPIISFAISVLLTWGLVRYRGRWAILDHPNARSLHEMPRPRSGGLAIVLGLAAGSGTLILDSAASRQVGVALWVALVAIVSFVDDIRDLSVYVRFAVHCAAAIGIVAGGNIVCYQLDFPFWELTLPAWAAMAVSILYLVWMLNLYNFMDGIDGLAGGMAVVGFGALAILGWLASAPIFMAFSLCIATAGLGFTIFNFPPARIFMGDVGASTLGFLAGVFTLWGARDGIFPFWIGVLVFSPFIVDATWTLLRRIAAREKPWEAHRVHAYQRLVQVGWTHCRVTLCEYSLMTSCAASAILLAVEKNPGFGAAVLLIWIVIYSVLGISVNRFVSVRCGSAA